MIVALGGELRNTLICLAALMESGDREPFEVIAVDDGRGAALGECLAAVSGLRYHRGPEDLGDAGAWNAGSRLARGEYLVFLAGDTCVQPGWLDALLRPFAATPGTGLVGPKVVCPDGRLWAAGGLVFSDGSVWCCGRFAHPNDPRYSFLREVDYCVSAAIAIRKETFERLGGFDSQCARGGHADADLAMKVRAAGLRVMFQPESLVAQLGKVASSIRAGAVNETSQKADEEEFASRWQRVLTVNHPAPGTPLAIATDRYRRRQVLIVDASIPASDRDSASLRLVNLVRLLRELNLEVTLVGSHVGKDDERHIRSLQQAGVETWYRPWLKSPVRWFSEHGMRFSAVIICRYHVADAYAPLARRYAPRARFIFDTVDLHFLRERREAELAGDKAGLQSAEKTRQHELSLIRGADVTWVVSAAERELLASEAPDARVEVVSNIHEIAGRGLPFADRHDLVFVGGFRHSPNVDAACWLGQDIFPRIRARLPQVTLHLIGADAPESVQILGRIDGIRVHGHVPNIDPYMDGCRVALAPLRYGAGVKGKVNLSMAHGQPVVATRSAVEGMHIEDGRDALVADDASTFADAVVALYRDQALWERLAENGLENVRRYFGMDAAREALIRSMA